MFNTANEYSMKNICREAYIIASDQVLDRTFFIAWNGVEDYYLFVSGTEGKYFKFLSVFKSKEAEGNPNIATNIAQNLLEKHAADFERGVTISLCSNKFAEANVVLTQIPSTIETLIPGSLGKVQNIRSILNSLSIELSHLLSK